MTNIGKNQIETLFIKRKFLLQIEYLIAMQITNLPLLPKDLKTF